MVVCCGFCGADLSYRPPTGVFGRIEDRCPDCGLDAESEQASLVPTDEEMVYSFREWSTSDRLTLRGVLVDRDVPFRWEPGPTLAVHENDVVLVEEILDHFDELVAESPVEPDEVDTAASDAAYEAMSSLFVVADRLVRSGWDPQVGVELSELEQAVRENGPPFGVEQKLWGEIRHLADQLCDGLDHKATNEEIVGTAMALRDSLQPLV